MLPVFHPSKRYISKTFSMPSIVLSVGDTVVCKMPIFLRHVVAEGYIKITNSNGDQPMEKGVTSKVIKHAEEKAFYFGLVCKGLQEGRLRRNWKDEEMGCVHLRGKNFLCIETCEMVSQTCFRNNEKAPGPRALIMGCLKVELKKCTGAWRHRCSQTI